MLSSSHSYSSNNNNDKNARIVIDFSWCWRGSRRGRIVPLSSAFGVDFVQIQMHMNMVGKIAKTKRKDSFSFWREERGAIWREEPRQTMDRARSSTTDIL